MFSSNSLKVIFLLAAVLFLSSCGFFRSRRDANATTEPFTAAEELKSQIPFPTKEPDVYQTEIVARTANGVEDKFFAARNAENRLTIFDYQTDSETAVLQIGDNQIFVIAANRKIYTEKEAGAASETADDFFTAEWLNRKTGARFESLDAENNLARYRVSLDGAANSEIIIYVDGGIGLPVKQEFYSVGEDGQKFLTSTIELKNFNAQTEAKFFELPKDCRRVSAREFYEQTQQRRREPNKK